LAIERTTGRQDFLAENLANLGTVLYLQGKLDESQKMLEESLGVGQRTKFKNAIGQSLECMGELFRWEGKADQARDKYREAQAIWSEIGNQEYGAVGNLSLAELDIEEGQGMEAEALARAARDIFRQANDIENQVWANAVLVRSLAEQGKSEEAAKELDSTILANVQNEEIRLRFALASADARAVLGKPSDQTGAIRTLEARLSEAKTYGYVGYELESRLALGKIEIQSGHVQDGRSRLAALERDARAKGFSFIARKAAEISELDSKPRARQSTTRPL
jgi:tetratricopeptide (TPR) repeat protein